MKGNTAGEAQELRSDIVRLEKQLDAEKNRLKHLEAEAGGKGEDNKFALQHAEQGNVVTRFPPEASGFMHIGHAKAALTNYLLSKKYEGRMVFRFDDTNPKKEEAAFETSIVEDTKSLGIDIDKITYTSDRFETMLELVEKMLNEGTAYSDDTDPETMKQERDDGIASKNRDNTVEKNMAMWQEMKNGKLGTVVRAKMLHTDPNKCLRDPVLYRVVLEHHLRTGEKYKVYPTYDFACPIVDALDGVTHALRTSEYNDRNPQYHWILDALKMRKPFIEDFSRLNMEFTVMSKRKLKKFVDEKVVDSWDDPRFPTVKGLLRRGLTVNALKEFIVAQGMSRVNNFQEWAQLWNYNCREIDPEEKSQCKRYTVIARDQAVPIDLAGAPDLEEATRPYHKKNPGLGQKKFYYSNKVIVEEEDMVLVKDSEEVTLMDWGNIVFDSIARSDDKMHVSKATAKQHLEGNFKKTKWKLTWLADTKANQVPVELQEYDHLITVKKLDPGVDDITPFVNKDTKAVTMAYGEEACKEIKKGDIVQFERRGYYICDSTTPHLTMIYIPDGKAKRPHLSHWSRQERLKGVAAPTNAKDERAMSLEEKKAKKKQQKEASSAAPKVELNAGLFQVVVGKIVEIGPHPDADALFVEKIDVGEAEPRTIVSGLRNYYKAEDLQGKMVAVLCNLKPANMRGVNSCGMVLCASTADKAAVKVLTIPEGATVGERVSFTGLELAPVEELPKKKVPALLEPLNTDEKGQVRWKDHVFTTKAGPVTSSLTSASVG